MKKLIVILLVLALLPVAALAETDESSWQNILLLGCDAHAQDGYDRSDSMIVVSVNSKTNQVKMTSLMRDMWVHIQGHGNQKLNAATVFGGPELAMSTVNEYFGLDIDKYVMVNVAGLVELIDTLGGVDLEITEEERQYINQGAKETAQYTGANADPGEDLTSAGLVHLTGAQAVCHARNRTNGHGDYSRTDRQRSVLMAIANKLKQENSLLTLMAVGKQLLDQVETNLSLDDLVLLATVGMNVDLNDVEQLRLPAEGTYSTGYVGEYWCIQPNYEKNAALLHDFIYGE